MVSRVSEYNLLSNFRFGRRKIPGSFEVFEVIAITIDGPRHFSNQKLFVSIKYKKISKNSIHLWNGDNALSGFKKTLDGWLKSS